MSFESVAYHKETGLLATGSDDGHVYVWHETSLLRRIQAHSARPGQGIAAMHGCDRGFATASAVDGEINGAE